MGELNFQKKEFTEEELVELAKRRIKLKRDLISHIAAYVIINGVILLMSLIENDFIFNGSFDHPWIVTVGWGIGLAFHISNTVQELRYKYNASAVSRELDKIKSKLK